MVSIAEFETYLKGEAKRSLHEVEKDLKRLSFNKPELLDDIKVSISHKLNELYFEMLDFIIWLEEENKVVKSRNIKVLIDDLRKDSDKVRDFLAYISTFSPQSSVFNDKDLFIGVQQNLIKRTGVLTAELEQYLEKLKVLEQELYNTSVILKRVDDYILQTPEMIGKIKQKINTIAVSNFLSQKESLISSLKHLSEQIEEQYKLLKNLKKVSALRRVLATLQLAKNSMEKLAETVAKTDPKVWKESTASFEVFREHLLKDLEGTLKIFTVAAEDLQDAQEQLAA